MKPDNRTVPGYEARSDSGAVLRRYAGVGLRLKEGQPANAADAPEATWLVKAGTIGGRKPRVGDLCWGTDGIDRVVKSVGALVGGEWEVVLTREDKS